MPTQKRRARRMKNKQDETTAKKNFSSLPIQLRELVLSKTDTDTRMKLFQINNEMREWVLKEELFGEDLEQIEISYSRIGSQLRITSRYGSQQEIDVPYVFKVVRRCKGLIFPDVDLDWTRIFPRLQSINCFDFRGMDLARLSKRLMGTAIQVTGSCLLFSGYWGRYTNSIDEILFQFIQKHLKHCKTIHFGVYPFQKLFDFLGTQNFPQAIFGYWYSSRDGGDVFERDLERILRNGIPSLHPDSVIRMIIRSGTDKLIDFLKRGISEGTDMMMENEAIRNKFLDSYGKVGGSLTSDPFEKFFIPSDVEFFSRKRNFDNQRNLIFLFYVTERKNEFIVNLHIKFDPTEE